MNEIRKGIGKKKSRWGDETFSTTEKEKTRVSLDQVATSAGLTLVERNLVESHF
jgi:hypothetical protein